MAYTNISDETVAEKVIPEFTERARWRHIYEKTFDVGDKVYFDASGTWNTNDFTKNLCYYEVTNAPPSGQLLRCVITIDFQDINDNSQ